MAESLQSGEQHCVVYGQVGLLRIDYSGEHAKLRLPWPENRLHWSGGSHCSDSFKVFGREWQVSGWEVDSERTWIDLVFSRVLAISEIPVPHMLSAHLRPASVDMAWAGLENALTSALVLKNMEPIEQLRHSELVPLGRAILGLTESVTSQRSPTYEAVETHLRAIRYLECPLASEYGRVPWRILPKRVRATLLRRSPYAPMRELLNDVFEGVPAQGTEPPINRQENGVHFGRKFTVKASGG